MERKQDLAKVALTALLLTSTAPINGAVDHHAEIEGIFLAAGCPAHGCDTKSPSKNLVADQGSPNPGYSGRTTNVNRHYQTADEMNDQNTVNSITSNLTETQLLALLNPQGRSLYLSLDSEGKALAIQLASQDSYRDKNLAIKEAQRRMNERRSLKKNH